MQYATFRNAETLFSINKNGAAENLRLHVYIILLSINLFFIEQDVHHLACNLGN